MRLISQTGLVFAICWIRLCVERNLPFAIPYEAYNAGGILTTLLALGFPLLS